MQDIKIIVFYSPGHWGIPRSTANNAHLCSPKENSHYKKWKRTCGGGSMKWNSRRSSTLSDFNVKTTFAKLVRWISGTVATSISFRYCVSVYNRNADPGPVRPARPDRWFALAWLIGYTCKASIPILGLNTCKCITENYVYNNSTCDKNVL